jgi:hypothetical protein
MGKVGSARERERESHGQVLTISCLFEEKRSDSKIYWVPMIPSQDAIPRKAEYISVNSLYIYGSC